jgi:hypothetical protein
VDEQYYMENDGNDSVTSLNEMKSFWSVVKIFSTMKLEGTVNSTIMVGK